MIGICANVQPSLSPQQKLDHIEGLDDTPDKGKKKKKGQLSKSDVSSDSDAYSGTPGEQMSDSGVSSVDVDMGKDLPMSSKAKIKAKGKYREQSSVKDKDNIRLCGLCNTRHGKGICYMTEDSTNLVEYREMLLNHASDEPWPVRVWTSPHMVSSKILMCILESCHRCHREDAC